MLDWKKHRLESRLPGEISIISDMQMTPPLWQTERKELKSLLMKVKEESEKAGLKFKSINSSALSLLYGPTHIYTSLLEKP